MGIDIGKSEIKLDGLRKDLVDAFDNASEEGVAKGIRKGVTKGVKDAEKNIPSQKITVPLDVEFQPKIKNKKLAETQIKKLKELENKNVLKFYSDTEVAKEQLTKAYGRHKNYKGKNSNTLQKYRGEVVQYGNAYIASGGDIKKLPKEVKEFYTEQSKKEQYGKGYQYNLADMKKAFSLMNEMINNGFDFSTFKNKFVGVAIDAAQEATEKINNTVEKTQKKKSKAQSQQSKIDNTDKIDKLKDELSEEEKKFEELQSKRNEITKRRMKREQEVVDGFIDDEISILTNKLNEKEQQRQRAFKSRMNKTGFYRTDKKNQTKKVSSFNANSDRSDFAYYDNKMDAADEKYISQLLDIAAEQQKIGEFNSEREALWYLRKEIKKRAAVQNAKSKRYQIGNELKQQIQYKKGDISNNTWGQLLSSNSSKEKSDLFNAINPDDLNLYKAYSEKSAERFGNFMQLLEQFCITAGSNFKGFEQNVEGINIEELYRRFNEAFPDDISKFNLDSFTEFVNNMTGMVKKSGLLKDGTFNQKKLDKFIEQNGSDDIGTRLLKRLGYQGYDMSQTAYGKANKGFVLFDEARKKNIIESSENEAYVQNAVEDYITNKVDSTIRAAVQNITETYDSTKAPNFRDRQQADKLKDATRKRKNALEENTRGRDQALDQYSQAIFDTTGKDSEKYREMLDIIGKLKYLYEQKGEKLPESIQSLLEEIVGQFTTFEKEKTERSPMFKSDIRRELERLSSLAQNKELSKDIVNSQINEAFGLTGSKADVKTQQEIYSVLSQEELTMEDLVGLSEKLYTLEKERAAITEEGNTKKKNETYSKMYEGYESEKEDFKNKKSVVDEFKKEYKEVDKELDAARKSMNSKRKELLQAEFEQLVSSVEPRMTDDEIDAIYSKADELFSKSITWGLDSGRGNLRDKIDAFRKSLNIEMVDKVTRELYRHVNEETDEEPIEIEVAVKDEEIEESAKSSAAATKEEDEAMAHLGSTAKETAEAKEGFANANAEVLTSIIESLKGLTSESELFKYLDQVLSKLSDNDGVDKLVENLNKLKTILNSPINEQSFISSIKELAASDNLDSLAVALKASKDKIKAVKQATQTTQTTVGDTNEVSSLSDIGTKLPMVVNNLKELITISKDTGQSPSVEQLVFSLGNLLLLLQQLSMVLSALNVISAESEDNLPIIATGLNKTSDAAEEVVEDIENAITVVDKFENKASGFIGKNDDYPQHNPVKYTHRVRQNADGTLEDVSRSFTAKDELGNTKTYTRHSDGTIDASETVNYIELVNQASKALIELTEVQHKIDVENEKSSQDLNYLGELYIKLTNAIERYNEAMRVATGHHIDYRDFLNDPRVGSKYDIDSGFIDAVRAKTTAPIADINAKYRKQAIDRTNTYKKRINSAQNAIEFEIENGNHTDAFTKKLENLLARLQNFDAIDVFDMHNIEEAEKALNEYKDYNKSGKLSANKQANENSVAKGLSQINSILSGNTKSAFKRTDVYKDLISLQNAFKNFDTERPQEALNVLMTKLLQTKARFEELGDTVKGKNFFETFVERLRGANAQLIAQYLSFQDIIRYIRSMATTLIDLDTQLVDLRKTTSMNNIELEEFYHNSSEVAKELGVTTSEVIQQASAWSRLGYNTKEASTEMAKLSSQFASISPGMSTDEAQTGLVSVMKAWDVDVVDVEREIMDNINVLGNNFAETNADIITGMEKAGATLSAIGTDYKDAFALFTGAQEVIQNAETVGTAMKTLSLRIRGYDEETEELSDDVINAMGKVADLTKVASNNFAGVSLWADADQTKYRSLKEYLGDIAKIFDEISEGNRTKLLENLFGKRGASVGSAILGNFDQVEKALEQMENAAGSADREMGIIQDSLEFKLNAIKQEWVETLTATTDRGDLGGFLDVLLKISEALGDLISKFGVLKSIVISLGTIWGAKNLG